MKAIVIHQYGGADQLHEAEVPMPEPEAHQVIVRLSATSINPIDWKLREGYLKQAFDWTFPIILGWDVAGVIVRTGDQVSEWKAGDRVFARPATTPRGSYAEYTAVDEDLLARIPDHLSFEEAAAIPLAGLTAWQALFDYGKLKTGEKVLIHAGAGGVGSLAIQFAKYKGASVYTTASAKNHDFVKKLGADETIDYQSQDFTRVLHDMDLVFDTVGGQVQRESFKVLKKGSGRLISIVNAPDPQLISEYHVQAQSIWLKENGRQLKEIADLLASGKVKASAGTTLPFSEKSIREAHRLSETGHARGKIVVSFDSFTKEAE
ncbi:NADP-dependent oxidoreductase [Sporolactobacillus sp. CPB3-1]|uniref:NADP-dependent oxidoreductase n=1 Tax=Sporolactobacillus mangiferae TaxID=2940498 RepID=A0ABT0MDA8_9BACL|nr:NADP-dependent oxidoreductase [Sporolactobacillus mangiferae]MCL1632851.1 NADP-dependent oxidoreductase [Sporolactobacillus mangiferae]